MWHRPGQVRHDVTSTRLLAAPRTRPTTGPAHGWTLLFPDRHPHAGGPHHYAADLANTDHFEVELVASEG
jgi:hypothetical protein